MNIRTGRLIVTGTLGAAALTTNVASSQVGKEPPQAVKTPSNAKSDAPAARLWHCGMHPQVIQDHPGFCPICHMADAAGPCGSCAGWDRRHRRRHRSCRRAEHGREDREGRSRSAASDDSRGGHVQAARVGDVRCQSQDWRLGREALCGSGGDACDGGRAAV